MVMVATDIVVFNPVIEGKRTKIQSNFKWNILSKRREE